MIRTLSSFCLLFAVVVALGGCSAQQPTEEVAAPALTAPWTGTVYATNHALARVSVASRSNLIADGDLDIPRAEKYVEGSYPLANVSSSSVYTYDSQAIGLPNGSGYRHRWVVQNSITAP